ncbi:MULTISPECIES: SAV_6107 family HEPN domain-containing protein [unclassified Corynebacterium]|uniref:SAV_6107 family HEPN domain-containing protein n=1 Tax=unclassified Corynebacterium TaxID=2624378 RepID=UPI00264B71CC|nr:MULTISPECIES: SAV_6107 family HEPN domain-containing protein [unclassified Corynebacterium]MDN8593599.1 SAV_6107 family HEPN domain-containing protein [Corynebacterium sp. P4_F2]WKK55726.1 SAV_6107 family HEPN domain-containing protein [Corynebacterium sp. P4-C1]WKK63134.1 SAV_6107 family HEPN domain-containing protein [Corynebacterium sp. P8-C1]
MISATTGAVYGATPAPSRHDEFLSSAHAHLNDAHDQLAAGTPDLALESAYRAALRTAGAAAAQSPVVAKRKRLPTSAWDKLALTGPRGKYWADTFSGFSRLRGRVASGIELRPRREEAERLLDLASSFYGEIAGEEDGMTAA